jgi:hypothetical protein
MNNPMYETGDAALRVVNHKAIEMAEAQDKCERGYAQLGWLILEVATMQYWRVHHETFRDYLRSVALVSKKTPGQLQLYFLTVRDLSDTFKPAQLEAMGITKAVQLRAAKDYAIVLPAVLVNAALDPGVSVKELKKLISTTLKLPSDDDGDWMDLEMEFMVSPEERALFEQVINVAMHTDPLTKSTISKSAQMKDVMIKLAMEFLGAHSGDGQ